VEQRVVVAAAEGELRDGVGRRQFVPRLVTLENGNADLRLGAFDVLVGDPAFFGGGVGAGLLGGGHLSS